MIRTHIVLLTTTVLAAIPAVAAAFWPSSDGYAAKCYQQSIRAAEGAAAGELSVTACNRALKEHSRSRDDRSILVHNRGVIELANGNEAAARQSFERAVRLSNTVDMRNLALAQLAHRTGDYVVAIEHYDALLSATELDATLAGQRDVMIRNRSRAVRSLRASAEGTSYVGVIAH